MRRALALVSSVATAGAAFALGCSSSSSSPPAQAAPPSCVGALGGNVSESVTLPAGCAVVTHVAPADDDGGAGGYVFALTTSTAQVAALSIRIHLGDAPPSGSFSSATVADWTASGQGATRATCTYLAGGDVVPAGSFSLEITSVDAGVAHGTVSVSMLVHAPLATDCGPGDVQTAAFAF
jgi:hypothetical protein